MTNRIRYTSAAQVAEDFPSAAEAVEAPMDAAPPLEFMRAQLAAFDPTPGLAFAAYALPRREAIWWACICLRMLGVVRGEAERGLAAAEAWARKPEEAERRNCGDIAAEQEFENAGALIAQAAFASGGSIAPAEFAAVKPDADITAKCVFGTLMVAIGGDDPLKLDERIRRAIASAIEFAEGGDGKQAWSGPAPVAPPDPDDEDDEDEPEDDEDEDDDDKKS